LFRWHLIGAARRAIKEKSLRAEALETHDEVPFSVATILGGGVSLRCFFEFAAPKLLAIGDKCFFDQPADCFGAAHTVGLGSYPCVEGRQFCRRHPDIDRR
jgi:hypothetical protein